MSLVHRLGAVAAALGMVYPGSAPASLLQTAASQVAHMETEDDRLVRVERGLPGFGGMFLGGDGRLVVYLLDPSRIPAARAVVESVFGPGRVPAAGVRAVRGRYTISQLKRWAERAAALFEIPGVTFVDMDEARNRVAIGLDDAARTAAVLRALRSLHIPQAAVVLDVKGSIHQMDTPGAKRPPGG
jgi:hypothetical protein